MLRRLLLFIVLIAGFDAGRVAAQIPRPQAGAITDVVCQADAAQKYAIYVPSNYSPDREWNLILAFDAGARGRTPVERFQGAAEKYGYIVAGSYNSRNGPWGISLAAAEAMQKDVTTRFHINPKRIYTAGQSGGARVAMQVAIDHVNDRRMAGVIASSAGFPDPSDAPKTLYFPVFGTAGTEDFNYVEMRQFDRDLKSTHRVEIFPGGHTWLPPELAMKAVEWMELQAMKLKLSPRNDAELKALFEARLAESSALKNDAEVWNALDAMVGDFGGLVDVGKVSARAKALQKQDSVKSSLTGISEEIARESKLNGELYDLVSDYANEPSEASLKTLRERVTGLLDQSKAGEDSERRRMARRVLAGLVAGSRGIEDTELQKLIAEIRPAGPPRQ